MVAKIISNRQSNIELLRILSMFFVLVGHVGMIVGFPDKDLFSSDFLSSFLRILIQGFSVVGVNIFVLISGWFGIKVSLKGAGTFLFQILFLLWAIYLIEIAMGLTSFDFHSIKISMGLTSEYWFVMAYLGMYTLTPILNAYVTKASEVQFRRLLIVFYSFQCYYCWISGFVNYFEGYSVVFFCGLYLTARYIKLYPITFLYKNSFKFYLIISILVSFFASIGIYFLDSAVRMLRYDNPLVIISSIALLLSFNKLSIQSNCINIIAKSSFAVYIIHFNPFIFPFFRDVVRYLELYYSNVSLILVLFLFMVVVFLICVVVDQIRICTWNFLSCLFKKTDF